MKEELGINEWLELIKEDKNLNGAYISISQYIYLLEQEDEKLKQRLNWVAFGDDPELALRYLRKIGYVDFDEERKLYINKHNNEPFDLKDEQEKGYYIKDEELDEYTKQLEYKIKNYKEVIDKAKELIKDNIRETTYEYIGSNRIRVLLELRMYNDSVNELLDILKEEDKYE